MHADGQAPVPTSTPDLPMAARPSLPSTTSPSAPRPAPARRRLRVSRATVYASISAVVLGGLLLALTLTVLSPGGTPAAPAAPAASGTTVGRSTITEGPGGRVALTRWALRRDSTNVGLTRRWWRGRFGARQVHVPMVANALPVTGARGISSFRGSVAWYRTTFDTRRAGSYALHFGSVNHLATVWLDGRLIGTHAGTYLPFNLLVHPTAGRHVLVVRADWRDPAAQARAGYHRTWFNFGGINREVSIRPVGASDLLTPDVRTQLDPRTGRAHVQVTVSVHNYGPPRAVTPTGSLSLQHGSESVGLHFGGQRIAHGATALLHAQADIDKPALWAPGNPHLYDLALSVPGESSYYVPVGLRELRWSRGHMYLNGRPLILHGASLQEDIRGHGDALTPADQQGIVEDLRRVGANATRSQHALDPALLERLDAAGILVWQGVGPVDPAGDWTANTPALMALAERRVRTSVAEAQAHPSVIAWNLANEIGGNGHRGGQQEYVHAMAAYLHAYDPGRLVAVDVWGEHPPVRAGALYANVDAVGETDYSGWYNGALDRPSTVQATIDQRLAALHRAFAGKVLIISEFGAEANAANPPKRPGGYGFQSRLLAQHVHSYEKDPLLSGMLVWDLRDFAVAPTFAGGSIKRVVPSIRLVKGINQKGVLDYRRRPKPAALVVRRLFAALPAQG